MAKIPLDYSPLLSKHGDETDDGYVRKLSPFVVSATKWTLRTLIFIIFVLWAAFNFLLPSEPVHELFTKWILFSQGSSFGITGSIFMSHSVPVLAVAFLAIAHLIISGEDQLPENKSSKYPRFRLWTFPVLINGPFGVVSATEFIGIVIFVAYVGTGLYVISSTLGFVILLALLNIYYINPFGVYQWWYKGLLFAVIMVASVVIFGGIVVGFWHM
ncbi:ferric reduction oxidase 7, chloroplastic-like [Vicia villosa]|uniref:ferric reduction oxidase 7, chloroplastic-like n=1 Tax=Vicia villosa TaxID=3911 RepID=UPI00273B385A|nr:ferric reduction oxidase 7, chloroplastic-like [Vicia villosa]